MVNIAITDYIIRNKMAISSKSPPELNPVVGFQSHKIWQLSDYSFTSAWVWHESTKQKDLRKGDSEEYATIDFFSLKENLFICRMQH